MADPFSTIVGVIDLLSKAKHAYDKFQDAKNLPETFGAIASQIELASSIFQDVGKATDDQMTQEVIGTIEKCETDAQALEEMYAKILENAKSGRFHRGRFYLSTMKAGRKVEIKDIWQRMLDGTLFLATKFSMGKLQEIQDGMEEMKSLPSSLENDTVGRTLNSYGDNAVMQNGASSFNDSGYGGSTSSTFSKQQSTLPSSHSAESRRHGDDPDNLSIRTDGRVNDLPDGLKASLASEFVSRLITDTKKHMKNNVLAENVGDLLRDYAVLLEKVSEGRVQDQAATFIRHQRSGIAAKFQQQVQAWKELGASHEVTAKEIVRMLSSLILSAFELDVPSIIHESQHPYTLPESPYTEAEVDGGEEDFKAPEIELSFPFPKDVPEAAEFLLEGPEYRWLVNRLKSLISQTQTGSEYCNARKTLLGHIALLPTGGVLKLALDWQPKEFLQVQYQNMPQDLRLTVVFCGRADTCYATTALHYIETTWPTVGRATIECIQSAVSDEGVAARVELEGAIFQCQLLDAGVTVNLTGSPQIMAEFAEACTWLTVACRASGPYENTAYSVPSFIETRGTYSSVSGITVRATTATIPAAASPGLCWLGMVQDPVLAMGYPIPYRHPGEIHCGLETSFELMVALSKANWLTKFDNTPLLKGLVSALVPIWITSTTIAWHFLVNQDGSRMTYNQACALSDVTSPENLSVSFLEQRRHFVGLWTDSARVLAGSKPGAANPDLYEVLPTSESLPVNHPTISWDGLSLAGGTFIQLGLNFRLGRKDTALVLASSAGLAYEVQLSCASKITVLFYGEIDKRGWLLDGATALVHLTRAWLASDEARYANKDIVGKLRHHEGIVGKDGAMEVLLSMSNRGLEIFGSSQGLKQDSTAGPALTYEGLVVMLWRVLEAMTDKAVKLNSAFMEMSIKMPSLEHVLRGWDTTDLLENQAASGQLHLRGLGIGDDISWLDFVKQRNTVVLFAATFGDLIRPDVPAGACPRTWLMPKDRHYVAIPLYLLQSTKRFLLRNGDHSRDCVQIADHIYWNGFEPDPLPCQCQAQSPCAILSTLSGRERSTHHGKSPSQPVNMFKAFPNGCAIIGGPNKLRKQPVLTKALPSSTTKAQTPPALTTGPLGQNTARAPQQPVVPASVTSSPPAVTHSASSTATRSSRPSGLKGFWKRIGGNKSGS